MSQRGPQTGCGTATVAASACQTAATQRGQQTGHRLDAWDQLGQCRQPSTAESVADAWILKAAGTETWNHLSSLAMGPRGHQALSVQEGHCLECAH